VIMAGSVFASTPPEEEAFSFSAAVVEWSDVHPVVSPTSYDPIDAPLDTPTRINHARDAFDWKGDHVKSSFRLESIEWSSELQPGRMQTVCCPNNVPVDSVAVPTCMPQSGKIRFTPPPRLAADAFQFVYGGC